MAAFPQLDWPPDGYQCYGWLNRRAQHVAEANLLRQLIQAGATGSREEFREVAKLVIETERQKNHNLLARDLERILYGDAASPESVELQSVLPAVPTDRERNLALIEIRQPVRSLGDIVLSTRNREALEETVREQGKRDVLGAWGLRPNSRLLFCGPPGCGKTLAGEVLATELGLPLLLIRFDAVVSSFLGETAANLRKVFDYVEGGRYVCLFDEFDAIGKEREDATEHGELRRVVSAFLQMLDSYRGTSVVVAASNHEGILDRALWRRFDEVLQFGKPNNVDIQELLEVKLRAVAHDLSDELDAVVTELSGKSHADIERIVIRAIKGMALAGRRALGSNDMRAALEREGQRPTPD